MNIENDVNMIIYTEITNGYLMHLYAVLAEASEGVAHWSYEAARQVTPWSTLPRGHISESVHKPSNDNQEKDLDLLLGVGGNHHRRLST